jgi:hypothetical protein
MFWKILQYYTRVHFAQSVCVCHSRREEGCIAPLDPRDIVDFGDGAGGSWLYLMLAQIFKSKIYYNLMACKYMYCNI